MRKKQKHKKKKKKDHLYKHQPPSEDPASADDIQADIFNDDAELILNHRNKNKLTATRKRQ